MIYYSTFLLIKSLLNIGAGVAAIFMKKYEMAGFWILVGFADLWIALWSLK